MAQFERDDIEAAVDGLIAMLDQRDGDADLEADGDVEPNGDELDTAVVDFHRRDPAYRAEMVAAGAELEDAEAAGDEEDHTGSEDDFVAHYADGPGCPVADPDFAADDVRCDPSWTEWHGRGRHKVDSWGAEIIGASESDDAEDDDPREQDDEAEDDDPAGGNVTDQPHDEEPGEDDPTSLAARRPHRDRIRRTRCRLIVYPGNAWRPEWREYRLNNLGRARVTMGTAL